MTPNIKSPNPKHKLFTTYWEMLIPGIAKRENLKTAHLLQLQILCNLHVEYDELIDYLNFMGRTYESTGRNGLQIKMRPEVARLNVLLDKMRDYYKLLGLTLFKDTDTGEEEEEDAFK